MFKMGSKVLGIIEILLDKDKIYLAHGFSGFQLALGCIRGIRSVKDEGASSGQKVKKRDTNNPIILSLVTTTFKESGNSLKRGIDIRLGVFFFLLFFQQQRRRFGQQARDDLDSLKATEVRVRKMSSQQKQERSSPFYCPYNISSLYMAIFVTFVALCQRK